MVGDILSITPSEIGMLIVLFVACITFWAMCFNKLMCVSVNETLAASRHIKVITINNVFAVINALIVMLSIKWVGVLIINALLILPAAAARNLAGNVREYTLYSVLISMFSGVTGLILSFFINTATRPTIVIISAKVFFMTLGVKSCVKG